MFEVQDLKFATLATVSRCGMVWFSEHVLTAEMIFENYLNKLKHMTVEESEDDRIMSSQLKEEEEISPALQVGWRGRGWEGQGSCLWDKCNSRLSRLRQSNGLVQDCCNSSALTLELLQSSTKPLKYWWHHYDTFSLSSMEMLQSCTKPLMHVSYWWFSARLVTPLLWICCVNISHGYVWHVAVNTCWMVFILKGIAVYFKCNSLLEFVFWN